MSDVVFDQMEPVGVGGRFYTTSRRLHLTYVAVPPLEDGLPRPGRAVELLRERLVAKGYGLGEWSACCELGVCRALDPPRPHPHTHVAIEIVGGPGKRYQLGSDGLFEIMGARPHVRVVRDEAHWRYLFSTYHGKEGGPWEKSVRAPRAWAKDPKAAGAGPAASLDSMVGLTEAEAVRLGVATDGGFGTVGGWVKAHGIVNREAGKERADAALLEAYGSLELYEWQDLVTGLHGTDATARAVPWVYDPTGSSGKTRLAKYLVARGEALVLKRWSARHVLRILQKRIEAGTMPKVVIFDAARAAGQEESANTMRALYRLCEEIVDGMITGQMYDADSFVLPVPLMPMVFSNRAPDIREMTPSRWAITMPGPLGRRFSHTFRESTGDAVEMINTTAMLGKMQAWGRQIDLDRLAAALAEFRDSKGKGGIKEGLAHFWENCFGKDTLERYWRAGYELEVRISETKEATIRTRPWAPGEPAAELQVTGRLTIVPVKMDERTQAEADQWMKNGRKSITDADRLRTGNAARAARGLPPLPRMPTQWELAHYGARFADPGFVLPAEPDGAEDPAPSGAALGASSEGDEMPYQDEEDDGVGTEPAHVSEVQSTRSDVAPSRPRRAGWAVYCRTAGSVELAGEALETDVARELARQRDACTAYARNAGLAPVAGPQQIFEDRCAADAPFGARPGLAALLASGAAGILCLDHGRLSDGSGDPAGWLRAAGLEFCTA